MDRYRLAVVLGAFSATLGVVAACSSNSLTDDSSGPNTDAGDPSARAEALFRRIEPSISESCGGAGGVCHVQGVGGAPSWLKDPDRYVSIKAYSNSQTGGRRFINEVPEESRLFTKGKHSGNELNRTSPLGIDVVAWINAEVASATAAAGKKVTTEPTSIADGTDVTISLKSLGSGMKGASVSFSVSILGSLLTLGNMKATAPAANGIRLTHPLFIQVVGNRGTPDPGDSCANVDTKVKEGASSVFGPGTLVVPAWTTDAKIAISFDAVGPYSLSDQPITDGGFEGSVGGCKNLPGFQAIADNFTGGRTINCVGCHAGGNAQNSLDLAPLASASPDYKTACAAALNTASLTNKANSPLILAPTGGLSHAGGALPAGERQTYKDAILSWLAGE